MKELQELQDSLQEVYIQEQTSKDEYELTLEQSKFVNEQVIQEMIFNKDDLQDPKTLEKILERMKKKEPIFNVIGAIASFLTFALSVAISIITTGAFTVALAPFLFILSLMVFGYIHDIPRSQFKKDNEKFKKKVNKLKEKTQEKLDKETDNSKKIKYKEIIKNCDKVLAEIERREKEKKAKEFEKEVKEVKEHYNEAIGVLEHPEAIGFTIYDYEISPWITILQLLGVNYSDFLRKFKSVKFKPDGEQFYVPLKVRYIEDTGYFSNEEEMNDIFNNIPEYKSNSPVQVIYEEDGGYSFIFYSQKLGKFMQYIDPYGKQKARCEEVDLFKKFYNKDKINMEALIEADKELGYYILSDCPPGLKKKKLPL